MVLNLLPSPLIRSNKSAYPSADEVILSISSTAPGRRFGSSTSNDGAAIGAQISKSTKSTDGMSFFNVSRMSPSLNSIQGSTSSPASFQYALACFALSPCYGAKPDQCVTFKWTRVDDQRVTDPMLRSDHLGLAGLLARQLRVLADCKREVDR